MLWIWKLNIYLRGFAVLFCILAFTLNLKELHGYDELQSVQKAHAAMSDIAEFTNEVKRDSETLSIIRQIEVLTLKTANFSIFLWF